MFDPSTFDHSPPDPAMTEPPRTRMVVHYRQNGITVTSHYFTSGGYRYEISQLSGLRRTRGSTHPGVIVGLVTAVAEAVVIVPLVNVVAVPVAWLLGVAALIVAYLVGYVCVRRRPPQHELLATYRGRDVTLFATRNEREFGQITRALQRAMEARIR
jgi:hypothetical protein